MKKTSTILLSIFALSLAYGQETDINKFEADYINWYNKDLSADDIMGTSVDKAYIELLNNLTPKKTVVVAVIDGGVDILHEDLEGRIWINEDEIPNNGIDDDKNGYIDDVYGWNFIGNKSGENVFCENLEITRVVKAKDENYAGYAKAKELYDLELSKRKQEKKNYQSFKAAWDNSKRIIKDNTGIEVKNQEDLLNVKSDKRSVIRAYSFLNQKYSQGVSDELVNSLLDRTNLYLDCYLNLDLDARSLVGDNPLDLDDKVYGNNDVIGGRSSHGTSVAGVIAAQRNNNIGINGIAENVRIMTLKSTPDGDERDKDVALAIMYAVDNGADIINMSFGKELSPQKTFVDQAVQYAEDNGVLLIHAAGNEAKNLDVDKVYPTDVYPNETEASN